MRAALLPFILKGNRAVTLMHNIKPITDPINASMKRAKANGDKLGQQQYTMKLWQTYKEHNVSPLQPMWAMVQMPVFISFFLASRKMGMVHVPGMEDGGFAWFTNLTVADPTMVLPVAASVLMLLNIEVCRSLFGVVSEHVLIFNILFADWCGFPDANSERGHKMDYARRSWFQFVVNIRISRCRF